MTAIKTAAETISEISGLPGQHKARSQTQGRPDRFSGHTTRAYFGSGDPAAAAPTGRFHLPVQTHRTPPAVLLNDGPISVVV